jgi:hypothetical protein
MGPRRRETQTMPQRVGNCQALLMRTEILISLETSFADCFTGRTTGNPAVFLRTAIFRQFSLSFRRLPL